MRIMVPTTPLRPEQKILPLPTLKTLTRTTLFPDYEHFYFAHAQKPYLEFPILESGTYSGEESPGADRVVIGSIAEDFQSAVFCAVLTHDGSTKNGFTECKDDTVNTDGKGTYDAREGWGRGREEEPGRRLVEKIEL